MNRKITRSQVLFLRWGYPIPNLAPLYYNLHTQENVYLPEASTEIGVKVDLDKRMKKVLEGLK